MILNNSSSCFVGIVLLGSLYLVFAPGGVIKLTKFALLLKLTYRVTINFQSTSLCLREYVNEQYFDDTINLQEIAVVYHQNILSRKPPYDILKTLYILYLVRCGTYILLNEGLIHLNSNYIIEYSSHA